MFLRPRATTVRAGARPIAASTASSTPRSPTPTGSPPPATSLGHVALGHTHTVDLDRPIERQSGDQVTTHAHDPLGRLTRAANADADLRLVRDQHGRMTAETRNGRTLTSTYDRLVALRAAGRIIQFGYDPAGRETSRRFGTGLSLTHYAYDSTSQITDAARPGPGTLRGRAPMPAPCSRHRLAAQERGCQGGLVMNVQELRAALADTDIDPHLYCILEQPDDSQWCLRKQGRVWQTFWFERGAKYELQRFKDEHAACEYFFNQVTQRAF